MPRPARPRRSPRARLLDALRERDVERAELARRLHDGASQALSALGLHLDALRQDFEKRARLLGPRTLALQEILEGVAGEVRGLVRELAPVPVERVGLAAGLEYLADEARQLFGGRLTVNAPRAVAVPGPVTLAFYCIARQALDNAVRHSLASSIQVTVTAGARRTALEVRDNGRGFDVERTRRGAPGLGLLIMEAHAAGAGLQFSVASTPGSNTIVKAVYRPGAAAAGRSKAPAARRG